MASLLLPVIYLAFISLGLPDSLLGAAWPQIQADLDAPIAAQSAVSVTISICTVISSMMTARLVHRLGTGRLIALSAALTAAAMAGFSLAGALGVLVALAIPYGLGAGAIDAALNNYVALHYGARHMSWLHCCWGIGASVGPAIMGAALAGAGGWHTGYAAVAIAQASIVVILLLAVPLWNRVGTPSSPARQPASASRPAASPEPEPLAVRELLRLPAALPHIASFGAYCALESSTGLWTASYLTLARGVDAGTAAGITSLFYLGITAGRFVSGAVAGRASSEAQIRCGQALIVCGLIVLVAAPVGPATRIAVALAGLGCAPIYPNIVALTPRRFGEEASLSLVSLQMACAYAASALVPPLVGLAADAGGAAWIPVLLIVLTLGNIAFAERARAAAAR